MKYSAEQQAYGIHEAQSTDRVLGLELRSQDLSLPVLLMREVFLGFLLRVPLPDPSCDVMARHCSWICWATYEK